MANSTLQYDRNTVNLVFALKRSLPATEQVDFKLSSPDLIQRVKQIYLATSQPATKRLAALFLEEVGEPLKASGLLGLFNSLGGNTAGERSYRCAATLSEQPAEIAAAKKMSRKTGMYRGQVIE